MICSHMSSSEKRTITLTYKVSGYVNRGIKLWINSHCASHILLLSSCLFPFLGIGLEKSTGKAILDPCRMVGLLAFVFLCTTLYPHLTDTLKTCQAGKVSNLKSIIESSLSCSLPNKHPKLLNFPCFHHQLHVFILNGFILLLMANL